LPRSEDGSTTLEVAVVFPAVLVLVLLVIQAALYWHARDTALSAAQQGLSVAKVSGLAVGQSRAEYVAAQLGGITAAHASAAGGAEITVVVSGGTPSLVPGLTMKVSESAAGPSEAFSAP
jgi:Flp pilus assembly protein TadG